MKRILILLCLISNFAKAQTDTAPNIIIITSDGLRWQEIFNGADSAILFNQKYVADTNTFRYNYWAGSAEERRKLLMPFVWNFVAQKGQLWGNRNFENEVSVVNPYKISYPGYNEIFTGYNDLFVSLNQMKLNPNANILEYLNNRPAYKNKVAAFGSWKLFDYILNEPHSNLPINCGYESQAGDSLSLSEKATNFVQETNDEKQEHTRNDMLTFTLAKEYLKKNHPKVMYIGFGETDEFAHKGKYDLYLNQINLFDKFLSEIWTQLQSDRFYKNNTLFFITTDHGRGNKPGTWFTHGFWARGSKETWLMQFGNNIKPLGEIKTNSSVYSIEFSQTIAKYLGENFTSKHPVAKASETLLEATTINK